MRRRRSAMASSGMSIWKGRISVSLDMGLNLRELVDDEDGQPGRSASSGPTFGPTWYCPRSRTGWRCRARDTPWSAPWPHPVSNGHGLTWRPVSAVVRPRRGAPLLVRYGEQVEERADPEPFLGGVAEQAVVPDRVPGAPPGAVAGDVAGGLQVGHDGLDGTFGQSHDGADVPDPGLGVTGDLHEPVPVPVPGQERPAAAAALVRVAHAY